MILARTADKKNLHDVLTPDRVLDINLKSCSSLDRPIIQVPVIEGLHRARSIYFRHQQLLVLRLCFLTGRHHTAFSSYLRSGPILCAERGRKFVPEILCQR